MRLITNRLVQGDRVVCDVCGRTHQVKFWLNRNGFKFYENSTYNGYLTFETSTMLFGVDKSGWRIAFSRHYYIKNRGTTQYTQYIAVCPSCMTNSANHDRFGATREEEKQKFYNEFTAQVNENQNRVRCILSSQLDSFLPPTTAPSDSPTSPTPTSIESDDAGEPEQDSSQPEIRLGDWIEGRVCDAESSIVQGSVVSISLFSIRIENGSENYVVRRSTARIVPRPETTPDRTQTHRPSADPLFAAQSAPQQDTPQPQQREVTDIWMHHRVKSL